MLKKKREPLKLSSMKETAQLDMMVLPGFLLLLIFNYLPMFGVIIAFKDYNPNLGIWDSPWNGFENFRFFFTSQDAVRTIRNTVSYSLVFLVLDLIAGVTLALLFYNLKSKRALKFYNTVVILPRFLSAVLIAFVVYILLSPSYGVLNQVLAIFGIEGIDWYGNAKYWPVILTITHIWQTVGMNCIIYYAALMSLDDSLIEAAKLDGANKWQQTIYVVIPHIVPVMIINTILAMGSIFQGDFGLFYQTPKDIGLLYETTDVINTYTFRALQTGALEKSAAVGLFQSVIGLTLVVAVNALVRKISPDDSLF